MFNNKLSRTIEKIPYANPGRERSGVSMVTPELPPLSRALFNSKLTSNLLQSQIQFVCLIALVAGTE
jgi:hypothetical protein